MPLYQRTLTIHEKAFGPIIRSLPEILRISDTYRAQNQYPQAEVLYQRAVSIFRKSIGNEHTSIRRRP